MNNLMQLMLHCAMNGGNAEQALRDMATTNPMVAQALKMVDGKSPAEVNQIAANMARERGMTTDSIKQQILQIAGMKR